MSTATQKRPTQAAQTTTKNGTETPLLDSILDREVSYIPFMATDPITLNARMVLNYLCTPTKSGKVCDERQAIRFIRLCQARGLNPWEGDAYIVGYDSQDGPQFSLITAHQAFLKRAETHPEYDGIDSGIIVRRPVPVEGTDGKTQLTTMDLEGDYFEDGDIVVGGWATVHFKTRKYPMRRRLRLSVFNKGYSVWKSNPAGMICKCAEADALRSAFPNSLGGMYLDGEMPAVASTPAPTKTEALRQRMEGNGHAPQAAAPTPKPQEEPAPAPENPDADPIDDGINEPPRKALFDGDHKENPAAR